MRKERKHYTGEEKVAILRRYLLDKVMLSFGSITVAIGTISQSSGLETTPIDLVFVGGPSPFVLQDCAKVRCRSIDLQLTSITGKPSSLTLLDGSTFTTYAVNTITINALPGQHVIKPGQSIPIMLVRDASSGK